MLYGPPGTGKTLCARAVANRTDATFIRVIGSELVQKYVGEGARMVRELFEMARSKKACIIFFDEVDAIGGARFDDGAGGDNEVQRTMLELINQLDGFDPRGNIKVLMATNRPDTLDPALLRPGRIDRRVEFGLPDNEGRAHILRIHARSMSVERGIRFDLIARLCPNATGAELRSVATEVRLSLPPVARRYRPTPVMPCLSCTEPTSIAGWHVRYSQPEKGGDGERLLTGRREGAASFEPSFCAHTLEKVCTSPLTPLLFSRRSFALAASSPVRDCTRSTNDLACDDAYALPSSRVTVRESISAVRVEKSLSHASRKSGFLLSHVTTATSYFCTSRFAARESSRSARVANTCRERFRILPISVQPVPPSRNLTSASSERKPCMRAPTGVYRPLRARQEVWIYRVCVPRLVCPALPLLPAALDELSKRLPQDREEQALQAIGEVARLEPAPKKPARAFGAEDVRRGLTCPGASSQPDEVCAEPKE